VEQLPSSFRDPSGYVYKEGKKIFRSISTSYRPIYSKLMDSGLYNILTRENLLIEHEELKNGFLSPSIVPFISYPYEWSFSMLKDAALLTLQVAKLSLDSGMNLKDASSYNIQFVSGKPIFIDTLSFYPYEEGDTWPAYRQFCQHFLVPLALASQKDIRLLELLKTYIDGLPLNLGSRLLSTGTFGKPSLLMHITVHSKGVGTSGKRISMKKKNFLSLLKNLEDTIKGLKWKPSGNWEDYTSITSYSAKAYFTKKEVVSTILERLSPTTVLDLGANTGEFSRLVSRSGGIGTVAVDSDPACVELNYLNRDAGILPLVIDLSNPSPALGWSSKERESFSSRCDFDMVMGLALIHHLAIGNNIPLDYFVNYVSSLGKNLLLEFVPKEDPKVRKMLLTRADIFDSYSEENFSKVLSTTFKEVVAFPIEDSVRILYLCRR
jgi:SAM-dependent methyltransferase